MNTFAVGNIVICRFGFTLRELTETELTAFIAGQGLPPDIGVEPQMVLFDYEPPQLETVTLTSTELFHDGVGAWHAALNVTRPGAWRYRGRGESEAGEPFACTPDQMFQATRTF